MLGLAAYPQTKVTEQSWIRRRTLIWFPDWPRRLSTTSLITVLSPETWKSSKTALLFAAPSFLDPSDTFSLVSRYHVPFIREKYGWGADNLTSFMTYYSTACISLVMYKKFAWLSKTMIPGLLGTPNLNGPWITLLEIECSPGFILMGTYQVINL